MTYCCRCRWVHEDTRKRQPWQQLCTRHKRISIHGFGFVTDTEWDNAEPYLRCVDVNGGDCPLYEEIENADAD